MAEINLLKGGYIGKLGATIGQQWHGQQIVRSTPVGKPTSAPTQTAALLRFGVIQRTLSYLVDNYRDFFNIKDPKMTKLNKLVKLNKDFLNNIDGDYTGILLPNNTMKGFRINYVSETQSNVSYTFNRPLFFNFALATNIVRTTIFFDENGYYVTDTTTLTLPTSTTYGKTEVRRGTRYIVVMVQWEQGGIIYRTNPCSALFTMTWSLPPQAAETKQKKTKKKQQPPEVAAETQFEE
jgi:hypothetical protein